MDLEMVENKIELKLRPTTQKVKQKTFQEQRAKGLRLNQ